jgi:uncharacterized membrane protein YqiK
VTVTLLLLLLLLLLIILLLLLLIITTTDRTIPSNKPGIIIRDNEKRTCMLVQGGSNMTGTDCV